MDKFKIIYSILTNLEGELSKDKANTDVISPEVLRIDESTWINILEMLVDEGYIKGVKIHDTLATKYVAMENVGITLKGLDYLHNDANMKAFG